MTEKEQGALETADFPSLWEIYYVNSTVGYKISLAFIFILEAHNAVFSGIAT